MRLLDRDLLWDMQVLTAVVDGGSIASGARSVGVSPSATSKRIASLERRLGVQLLHRTTRHMRLTLEGKSFVETARDVIAALDSLETSTRDTRSGLRGEVRVTAPTVLGQELVSGIVARFLLEHPDVVVHLELSDRMADLAHEPYDLAVRVAPRLSTKDLVARRVGNIRTALVASPSYLERQGSPANVAGLSEHTVLDLAHEANGGTWRVLTTSGTKTVSVRTSFVCSSPGGLRQAVLAGLGIARLPVYLVHDDLRERRLVRLFPSCVVEQRTVFLVRPSRSYVPVRVRELADRIVRELPNALRAR
ncbi:MAG: LysR family transcriptional regulator [Labilithrix sp.]|nr:LysR family transcriptional regulator [Labilithrix sp.]MCW5833468.1 LysR family transcriptional regulator [Labilithrix sp.]